ncbi:MAG: hypothetical protein AUJ81_10455 [Helicobacteraceae bacterium CG1_02_36_14]|nr:MAG: hypothetical protein AUJ81_10455 [Helicobacteraceae bacterium CG1_02_36_14]
MLTKSDFLKYTQCYRYLWLYKYRKNLLPKEVDLSLQKLFSEGYEVEPYAYKLFPGGVSAMAEEIRDQIALTKKLVKGGAKTIFQPTVSSDKLFCRGDILNFNDQAKKWDVYEIKSALSVKDINIIDLAFQKICYESAGYKINKLHLVYINRDFVRKGEVDPKKLLKIEDLTEEVNNLISRVNLDIKSAYKILNLKEEPQIKILKQCKYPYACAFGEYCQRDWPEHNIYRIAGGLSEKKLNLLLDQGILEIKDIPEDFLTNRKSIKYHYAVKHNQVYIESNKIRTDLSQLEYPLYFLDYETYGSVIPLFDGYHPYQQIPFQYSLHIQEKPSGKLEHFAYLAKDWVDPVLNLAKELKKLVDKKGNFVAWNADFEKGRNQEMAEHCPQFADFFEDINRRMYDPIQIFRNGHYVHKDFHGSASLKSVLPVLVPELSYKKLNIQEGGNASESWRKMIDPKTPAKEKKQIYDDLLKYCQLDTLGMVEILKFLQKI